MVFDEPYKNTIPIHYTDFFTLDMIGYDSYSQSTYSHDMIV